MTKKIPKGYGILAVNLGAMSFFGSFLYPFISFFGGLLAIYFSTKQKKNYENFASKLGFWLGIIGILISIIMIFIFVGMV